MDYSVESAFGDKEQFKHAVRHAFNAYLSKAYGCTEELGRWGNQYAIAMLEDGRVVPVPSGKGKRDKMHCLKFYGSRGDAIDAECIDAIIASSFLKQRYELWSEHVDVMAKMLEDESVTIAELHSKLKQLKSLNPALKERYVKWRKHIDECAKKTHWHIDMKEELVQVKERAQEKLKSIRLDEKYEAVKDDLIKGGRIEINAEAVAKLHGSPIKHVLYRPNHGIHHSIRAAQYIHVYGRFLERCKPHQKLSHEMEVLSDDLTNKDMKTKLQAMMMFSVVGRHDETGFKDTSVAGSGRSIYDGFREASGKAYLTYALEYVKTHGVGADLENYFSTEGCVPYASLTEQQRSRLLEIIYRDAITVRLMGYSDIDEAKKKLVESPLVQAYVRECIKPLGDAKDYIANASYGVSFKLMPALFKKANKQWIKRSLLAMRFAHGLDLVRCYPLTTGGVNGPECYGMLRRFIFDITGLKVEDEVFNLDSADTAYEMLSFIFNAIAASGGRLMFQLRSYDAYKKQLAESQAELRDCKREYEVFIENVSSADCREHPFFKRALKEAMKTTRSPDFVCAWVSTEDDAPINKADAIAIAQSYFIYVCRTAWKKCLFDVERSKYKPEAFKAMKDSAVDGFNIDVDCERLVDLMDDVKKPRFCYKDKLPMIRCVDMTESKHVCVTVMDAYEADVFLRLCKQQDVKVVSSTPASYQYTVARSDYDSLCAKQLVTHFTKRPSKGAELSVLPDELITDLKAVVRVVDTHVPKGSKLSGLDHTLNELEYPAYLRWVPPAIDGKNRARCIHPKTGATEVRGIIDRPELRFQPFHDSCAGVKERCISAERGKVKHTELTKKKPCSLMWSNGAMPPFNLQNRDTAMPLGLLYNLDGVKHDDRYLWVRNSRTASRWWVDPAKPEPKHVSHSFDEWRKVVAEHADAKQFVCRRDTLFERLKLAETVLDVKVEKTMIVCREGKPDYFYQLKEDLFALLLAYCKDDLPYDEGAAEGRDEQMALYQRFMEFIKHSNAYQKLDGETIIADAKHAYSAKNKAEIKKARSTLFEFCSKVNVSRFSTVAHNEALIRLRKRAVAAFYTPRNHIVMRLNTFFEAVKASRGFGYKVPIMVIDALEGDSAVKYYSEAQLSDDLAAMIDHLLNDTVPVLAMDGVVKKSKSVQVDAMRLGVMQIYGKPLEVGAAVDSRVKKQIIARAIDAYREAIGLTSMMHSIETKTLSMERIDLAIKYISAVGNEDDACTLLDCQTLTKAQIYQLTDKFDSTELADLAMEKLLLMGDEAAIDKFVKNPKWIDEIKPFLSCMIYSSVNADYFLKACSAHISVDVWMNLLETSPPVEQVRLLLAMPVGLAFNRQQQHYLLSLMDECFHVGGGWDKQRFHQRYVLMKLRTIAVSHAKLDLLTINRLEGLVDGCSKMALRVARVIVYMDMAMRDGKQDALDRGLNMLRQLAAKPSQAEELVSRYFSVADRSVIRRKVGLFCGGYKKRRAALEKTPSLDRSVVALKRVHFDRPARKVSWTCCR